jgi:hypothetical protein
MLIQILSIIFDFIKLVLLPLTKTLKWIYGKLPFKVISRKPLPKLGIIESAWREPIWEFVKYRDKEVIAIHTYWQITNTLSYNLTALNVFLTKPERVKGHLLIKHYKSDIYGSYAIPKGYTTEADASFMIDKKYIKQPEDVIKIRIEFQDPVGRYHKLDQVVIKPIIKTQVNKIDSLKIEDPSKIKNKVEKQVVAVLKNEIEQYKVRGRREGRLGTVEWPRGTIEWRGMDEKIKFLFDNSAAGNVSSEHVKALLNLYNSSSPRDKAIIIKSLLNRIDKKSEYRNVGYLIIFFLFEIGHLEEGLKIALKKLKGDKTNAFSDTLRLLDFLLAFRYGEFEEAEMNTIEAFVYATKEHPFQIKERINAIRVNKLGV